MASTSRLPATCKQCGGEAHKKCRCGLAYYCGSACQKAAWPAHRRLCQTVTVPSVSKGIIQATQWRPAVGAEPGSPPLPLPVTLDMPPFTDMEAFARSFIRPPTDMEVADFVTDFVTAASIDYANVTNVALVSSRFGAPQFNDRDEYCKLGFAPSSQTTMALAFDGTQFGKEVEGRHVGMRAFDGDEGVAAAKACIRSQLGDPPDDKMLTFNDETYEFKNMMVSLDDSLFHCDPMDLLPFVRLMRFRKVIFVRTDAPRPDTVPDDPMVVESRHRLEHLFAVAARDPLPARALITSNTKEAMAPMMVDTAWARAMLIVDASMLANERAPRARWWIDEGEDLAARLAEARASPVPGMDAQMRRIRDMALEAKPQQGQHV